jgi:hypothetical protein
VLALVPRRTWRRAGTVNRHAGRRNHRAIVCDDECALRNRPKYLQHPVGVGHHFAGTVVLRDWWRGRQAYCLAGMKRVDNEGPSFDVEIYYAIQVLKALEKP